MSIAPSYSPELPEPPDAAHAFLSESFDDFQCALEELCILDNMSGRHRFYEHWPEVAQYLFGDELIEYDQTGVPDKDRRMVLEDEAEVRRLEILTHMETLEERSVVKGILDLEYVQTMIEHFGRFISLLLYKDSIVNRFVPLSVQDDGQDDGAKAEDLSGSDVVHDDMPDIAEGTPRLGADELARSIETEFDDTPGDPMDNIKPIDTQVEFDAQGHVQHVQAPHTQAGSVSEISAQHVTDLSPEVHLDAAVVTDPSEVDQAPISSSHHEMPPTFQAGQGQTIEQNTLQTLNPQTTLPPMPQASKVAPAAPIRADVPPPKEPVSPQTAPQGQGLPPMPLAGKEREAAASLKFKPSKSGREAVAKGDLPTPSKSVVRQNLSQKNSEIDV